MINFFSMKDWPQNRKRKKKRDYVIDFAQASNSREVILLLGASIRGQDSVPLHHGKLSALEDNMTDWFYENWGVKNDIIILNWDVVVDIDEYLAMKLLDVLYCAFLAAIYTKALDGDSDEIPEEINNRRILIFGT